MYKYFEEDVFVRQRDEAVQARLEIVQLLDDVMSFDFLRQEYGFSSEDIASLHLNEVKDSMSALFGKNIEDSVSSLNTGMQFLNLLGFGLGWLHFALILPVVSVFFREADKGLLSCTSASSADIFC